MNEARYPPPGHIYKARQHTGHVYQVCEVVTDEEFLIRLIANIFQGWGGPTDVRIDTNPKEKEGSFPHSWDSVSSPELFSLSHIKVAFPIPFNLDSPVRVQFYMHLPSPRGEVPTTALSWGEALHGYCQ